LYRYFDGFCSAKSVKVAIQKEYYLAVQAAKKKMRFRVRVAMNIVGKTVVDHPTNPKACAIPQPY
jgi:hypothetical protein